MEQLRSWLKRLPVFWKQLSSYFLFQKCPEEGLSKKRRILFWLWNALLPAGAAAALGLLSLIMAPGQYGWELFADYFNRPALVALNLLPPVVLAALLYGLTGRSWIACLVTALPVLGLSAANTYKLFFRDDPVVAADLFLLGEAGNMAGKYQLFLFGKLILAIAAALASTLLLALLARARLTGRVQRLTVGVSLACAVVLAPVYSSDAVYSFTATADTELVNLWSTTQQYVSRGFLYPFLHSVKGSIPTPPEGYNKEEAVQILEEDETFRDADIPEDQKVNIVGLMLEAFSDFSGFEEIEFTRDVYAQLHALEEESYSGTLLTNIFAGGTVNTERAFLTGVGTGDYDYHGDASSYVWYLKSQGYRASGDHPCNNWFYNRLHINSYLGFDQYRFSEDFYTYLTDQDTAWDYTFFPQLTASVLNQIEDNMPLFSFSVSYQGHGPYGDYECWWGEVEDYIANEDLDDASRYILSNYLGSVMNTQGFLTEMVDVFREREEPIVLVVFGDHKPWLGNGNSVYNALGIDLSQASLESFYNYWATPYLIWANDAAKQAVGNDFVGRGPDISPCFLMNVLFDQLGWKGDAYMQAVEQCWRRMPVIHTGGACITADGRLVRELDKEQAELVRQFRQLSYYRDHHFEPPVIPDPPPSTRTPPPEPVSTAPAAPPPAAPGGEPASDAPEGEPPVPGPEGEPGPEDPGEGPEEGSEEGPDPAAPEEEPDPAAPEEEPGEGPPDTPAEETAGEPPGAPPDEEFGEQSSMSPEGETDS